MFRTFALTAALATTAFVGGYYVSDAHEVANKIGVELKSEITGIQTFFASSDPQAEYFACYDKVLREPAKWAVKECDSDMQRWVRQDGGEAVASKIMARGMVDFGKGLAGLAPAR